MASELMHHLYQGFYENEGLKRKPQSFWNPTFSLVKKHDAVCNHVQSIIWLKGLLEADDSVFPPIYMSAFGIHISQMLKHSTQSSLIWHTTLEKNYRNII